MPSRRYRSLKFLYDDDRGRQSIKLHRSYLNPDGLTEDTPTTPLFFARVVDMSEKVSGSSVGLRHVLAVVGQRRLITKIPYRPSDPLLKAHIVEILTQPQVICGDYNGERLIKSGTTNSI
jgi:hypothetical protein